MTLYINNKTDFQADRVELSQGCLRVSFSCNVSFCNKLATIKIEGFDNTLKGEFKATFFLANVQTFDKWILL